MFFDIFLTFICHVGLGRIAQVGGFEYDSPALKEIAASSLLFFLVPGDLELVNVSVCEPRTWPVAFSRMARLWIMSGVLPWWPQLFDSRAIQ